MKLISTGEGSEIQLKNAEMIARKMGTGEATEIADTKVREVVDELVSLKLIDNMDKSTLDVFAKLAKGEKTALVAFAEYQKGIDSYVMSSLSERDALNRRKGFVRETYDAYVTSTVAPAVDEREMVDKGYKKVMNLPASKYELGGVEMALYVSKDMIRQTYDKNAVRFVGERQQGRTFFENSLKAGNDHAASYAQESVKLARKTTLLLNEAVMDGRSVKLEGRIVPEYNVDGTIADYRYNVTNEMKKHIGLELDGTVATG